MARLFRPVLLILLSVCPAESILTNLLDNFVVDILLAIPQALTCGNNYRHSGLPRRDDYNDVYFPPEKVLQNIPANKQGPVTTRGVFWLSYATEVMSFAPTMEGGGVGEPFAEDPPRRKVRLMSDRNWAVTALGTAISRALLTGPLDFAVDFVINQGTLEEPEVIDLFLDYRFPFTCSRGRTEGCGPLFPEWSLVLQNVPGGDQAHPLYSTSVVWRRESATILGGSSSYEAVQIADENGEPLFPAFDTFVNQASLEGSDLVTKVLRESPQRPQCSQPWCVSGIFC